MLLSGCLQWHQGIDECLRWKKMADKENIVESGIDVTPWINVAPGTFGKNIEYSPFNKYSPP